MLKMGVRKMQDKQRLIYGARIRLGWFMEAERLGSVSAACRSCGVPKSTFYFWHKRWLEGGKRLESLIDNPKMPKTHKRDPDEDTVSLVAQLRLGLGYGENQLTQILRRDYNINMSVHGVHNILSRAGLLEKRKKKVRKNRNLNNYQYKPGEMMQLDVKHWGRTGYQYDIIDCCTRIKFKYIFEDYNVNTTVKFLEMALKFFAPAFDIQLIQTDNGAEFTNNQFHKTNRIEPRMSLPERWCIAHNIEFRHIPPRSPHLNGRIERPHGVDKWRYKKMVSNVYKMDQLKEFCKDDCLDYNTYRPHSQLGWMTPLEFLQSLDGYENAMPNFNMLQY